MTETVVWTGTVTRYATKLSDVVIRAGSTLKSISGTATFTDADRDCTSVSLYFDTNPFLAYLAAWTHADAAGMNVSANVLIGTRVSPISDAHLSLGIATCWDSTGNAISASRFFSATATVKLT